jgi:hypothetical protein
MLFTFSAPVLIRHLWQLKTVIFLHRCLIGAVQIGSSQVTHQIVASLTTVIYDRNVFIIQATGMLYCHVVFYTNKYFLTVLRRLGTFQWQHTHQRNQQL